MGIWCAVVEADQMHHFLLSVLLLFALTNIHTHTHKALCLFLYLPRALYCIWFTQIECNSISERSLCTNPYLCRCFEFMRVKSGNFPKCKMILMYVQSKLNVRMAYVFGDSQFQCHWRLKLITALDLIVSRICLVVFFFVLSHYMYNISNGCRQYRPIEIIALNHKC